MKFTQADNQSVKLKLSTLDSKQAILNDTHLRKDNISQTLQTLLSSEIAPIEVTKFEFWKHAHMNVTIFEDLIQRNAIYTFAKHSSE